MCKNQSILLFIQWCWVTIVRNFLSDKITQVRPQYFLSFIWLVAARPLPLIFILSDWPFLRWLTWFTGSGSPCVSTYFKNFLQFPSLRRGLYSEMGCINKRSITPFLYPYSTCHQIPKYLLGAGAETGGAGAKPHYEPEFSTKLFHFK
jgi:hypothetical protein